jgi:hypothetical protein
MFSITNALKYGFEYVEEVREGMKSGEADESMVGLVSEMGKPRDLAG